LDGAGRCFACREETIFLAKCLDGTGHFLVDSTEADQERLGQQYPDLFGGSMGDVGDSFIRIS
jgi:hypothetical protein